MYLTALYAVLFYVAFGVLVIGSAVKIRQYLRTPSPLVIPLTPAPTNRGGVVWRLFKEIVLFHSLFRASKATWLFGWLFHFGLLLVLLHHLRFFTEPLWLWVLRLGALGVYPAAGLLLGLLGLLIRRCGVERLRYISAPSDYLMLLLLLAIALSGLSMKYVFYVDWFAVRGFMLGLWQFDWQPLPPHPALLIHLALVALLMLVFPFSKLLHAIGIFFSPTLTMPDNSRQRRHVNPWRR